jgi:hypothetical protein
MIMTPAAYHRETSPRAVSAHLIAMSSRLILMSMGPLALAICIDFYLVAWVVVHQRVAAALATLALLFFATLWFGFPYWHKRRLERPGGSGD